MDDAQLRAILNDELAGFFGKLEQRLDNRFQEHEIREDARHNTVMTTLDGIAKRIETDHQERTLLSHQVERQEGWIHQLADTTNTKLVTES